MIRGFRLFYKGLAAQPIALHFWLGWLGFINLSSIFFLNHAEARWTFLVMIICALCMFYLTEKFGFTRVLGLGHFMWAPLVIYLSFRVSELSFDDAFSIWMILVIVTNTISLIFDTIDVVRYLLGERQELK